MTDPNNSRQIPVGATVVRRTPTFTNDSVPPALLRKHHTTVWAQLLVFTGEVGFVEDETGWSTVATASAPVVIVPNRKHHVEPSEEASFAVQFYDEPVAGESVASERAS